MQERGLVLVASNADIDRQELAAIQDDIEARERRDEQVEAQLAGHIRRAWEVAKRHKAPVERRMLNNLLQISGRYSDAKAQEIKSQGLPLIYMNLTSVKCRAAKSWIRDVLMPAGDRPWLLKATPMPSLPPHLQQMVTARVMQDAEQFMAMTGQPITPDMLTDVATRFEAKVKQMIRRQAEIKVESMADLIEDQLVEGGWERALDDTISDVVDFPAGILKAPVIRRRRKIRWHEGGGLEIEDSVEPEVYRVDPFNFFPAPGVVDPDDGDCIELHEYSLSEIEALIGLPGYDEDAVRAVLRDYSGGRAEFDTQGRRAQQAAARGENSTSAYEDKLVHALEFWGSVQGERLLDWGMSEDEIPDPDAMHDIMAVLIGRYVVCVRMNPDPLGRKPYHKACFENVPGSFWGNDVPYLIRDCQNVCNAAARSLVANMGIASGPQVAVNTGSIPPGQDITSIYPWKIWQLDYSKTGANSRPPIDFFQPSPMTESLLKVFEQFSKLADEYSGIPAYTYGVGGSVGGAGRTASGLSMLMNAASKAIKNVIKHIDTGLIAPAVEKFYVHNMLWYPDDSVKGDAQVVARGALSLVAKEQNQMRLQELLAQSANPLDAQIIGLEGRAAMWRRALQGVDVGADEVVPSREDLAQMVAMQHMQQAGQPPNPREANVAGQPMGGPQ